MNDLVDFLAKNNFIIDDITYQTLKTSISLKLPILLSGRPGTGKTVLTKLVADYLGAEYIFFQCVQGTDSDDLIWRMVPSESTRSGIKLIDGVLLEAVKKSRLTKVVLVLDEFDKTRPNADALLLDFLQNCRVSIRIDDESTVVTGNPENLWVFLTSNDEREFSEPLMRRLVHIKLPLLSAKQVESILRSRGFSEEAVKLATQIYKDTISAGLSKVATVQELQQFCAAYDSNPEADFTSLVYSFVIKNDEDFERYAEYKKSGGSYGSEVRGDFEDFEDLSPYYEERQEKREEMEEMREERKPTRPRVKTVKVEIQGSSDYNEREEVTVAIPNEDFKGYTLVVKTFMPEPSDNPNVVGKFTVLNNNIIIAKDLLTFSEAWKLIRGNEESKSPSEIEVYYEDTAYFIDAKYLHKLIEIADRVYYYSKDRVAMGAKKDHCEEILELEFLNSVVAKVKCYYKGRGTYRSLTEYIASLTDLREVFSGVSEWMSDFSTVSKYVKIVSQIAQSTIVADDSTSYEFKVSTSTDGKSVAVILGGNLAKFIKQRTGRDTFSTNESSTILELVREYYSTRR